jgi:alkylation response protein AidB-like acyl-CoA dehydrogenase
MWDLLQNEDEAMVVGSVREFLQGELPIERLRPRGAPSVDAERARTGMVELGWFGVGLPEEVGGSGLGLVEEMLIQRECGRFLASPSVLATTLAGHVALQAGDMELAAAIVAGEVSASLGMLVSRSWPEPAAAFAFDWNGSDPLLVWNDMGMGLFDASAFSDATVEPCLDDSVTMHAGRLTVRRPRHWVSAPQAPLALRAEVLLAAALTGLAEHACDLTVEYAKVREQFSKPIGTFQAVKHRCADMGVRARLAWYQTSLAALKVQLDAADAGFQAASAKLVAAQAAHENGRAGIQLHGGIGFQAECDAHWFMKRAHVYDRAGGSMQRQARRIAAEPSPWDADPDLAA